MGMDLMGNGRFSVNNRGWETLLDLAERFGWRPAGTIEMDYEEGQWSHPDESTVSGPRMGYFSNDSQLVTDTDAAALSAALRKALEHPIEPAESRSFVEEFAAYCAKGGFRLY